MAKKLTRRQHRKAVANPPVGRKPSRKEVRTAFKRYKGGSLAHRFEATDKTVRRGRRKHG